MSFEQSKEIVITQIKKEKEEDDFEISPNMTTLIDVDFKLTPTP